MISFRTDIGKNKYNTKKTSRRWKAIIALNICLAVLCAATFVASAFTVRANAANYDTEKTAAEEWYHISDDGKTLSVHLDGSVHGYEWKYGLSNSYIREMRFMEITDEERADDQEYEWNVHFTSDPTETGDVILTLQCIKNQESGSIDTRTIPLHVQNGILTLN